MAVRHTEEIYRTEPVELTIHLFDAEPRPAAPRGAMVFFFGGGWNSGQPTQFFPHCEHFAARGLLCASAEYRVKSRHGVAPQECVKDAKSAVRWLRANAARFGVDPNRVAAGGGSAGGHLAATTALCPGFEHAGEDMSVSSRPDALLLFNPVLGPDGQPNFRPRFGDTAEALSPLAHVAAGAPPTIIFHGRADTTVPIAQIETFRDRMQACGNRCELIAFDDMPHGFFNFSKFDGVPYRRTIEELERFLPDIGWDFRT